MILLHLSCEDVTRAMRVAMLCRDVTKRSSFRQILFLDPEPERLFVRWMGQMPSVTRVKSAISLPTVRLNPLFKPRRPETNFRIWGEDNEPSISSVYKYYATPSGKERLDVRKILAVLERNSDMLLTQPPSTVLVLSRHGIDIRNQEGIKVGDIAAAFGAEVEELLAMTGSLHGFVSDSATWLQHARIGPNFGVLDPRALRIW
jgi:hypothetical protein